MSDERVVYEVMAGPMHPISGELWNALQGAIGDGDVRALRLRREWVCRTPSIFSVFIEWCGPKTAHDGCGEVLVEVTGE